MFYWNAVFIAQLALVAGLINSVLLLATHTHATVQLSKSSSHWS